MTRPDWLTDDLAPCVTCELAVTDPKGHMFEGTYEYALGWLLIQAAYVQPRFMVLVFDNPIDKRPGRSGKLTKGDGPFYAGLTETWHTGLEQYAVLTKVSDHALNYQAWQKPGKDWDA